MPKQRRISKFEYIRPILGLAAILTFVSFFLAAISQNFSDVQGWFSFLAILAISAVLFWLAWRVVREDHPPRWLLYLTIGAATLRLMLGVVWFLALPVNGYDTDIQRAGYVMEDAFNRDRAAWEFAQSDEPLLNSFTRASSTDQYGGLLFISAGIYRYIGGDQHQPLLVLTLAAAVSGLAVIFTWAFTRRLWGERVAHIAAWAIALFPEAVLLGSSQMREAFTVTLTPLALYGLLRFHETRTVKNFVLMLLPVALTVPLTWAFIPSLLVMLVLVYLALEEWRPLRSWRVWLVIGAVAALLLAYFVVRYLGDGLWLVESARWQAYVSQNASGWVAREFERMPVWMQVPFLVGYGILRPLLPAAIVDSAPVVWMAIGIWRALGWTILLALLLYATYVALRNRAWKQPVGALLFSSWLVTFVASYRGGGDLWDNPRYRSAFAAVQVAVAAWVWVQHSRVKGPWLRRLVGGGVLALAWFIPWYLRRYTDITWNIVNLDQVIGLGLVSVVLLVIWDWVRTA